MYIVCAFNDFNSSARLRLGHFYTISASSKSKLRPTLVFLISPRTIFFPLNILSLWVDVRLVTLVTLSFFFEGKYVVGTPWFYFHITWYHEFKAQQLRVLEEKRECQ